RYHQQASRGCCRYRTDQRARHPARRDHPHCGEGDGRLTFGFLLGLGIAVWSANAGMKAIFDALNVIYDEDEKRGLIRLNLVSLLFTICAIVGVGLALALVLLFSLL